MLIGFNHLTLAVSDVTRSLDFYHGILALPLHARWDNGAYLSCGTLWLCLSYDPARRPLSTSETDYTHYAFTVEAKNFSDIVAQLQRAGVEMWKNNRSEGDSYYFLDPDGHKLEVHVGDLQQRLAACRLKPYSNMRFY